jgi:glucokinase
MLIVGDIGGTKSLLALYELAGCVGSPVAQMEYPSANYPALDVMVREFLVASKRTVRVACFDVAGPVIGGSAHLTNLPWTIDAEALRTDLGGRPH